MIELASPNVTQRDTRRRHVRLMMQPRWHSRSWGTVFVSLTVCRVLHTNSLLCSKVVYYSSDNRCNERRRVLDGLSFLRERFLEEFHSKNGKTNTEKRRNITFLFSILVTAWICAASRDIWVVFNATCSISVWYLPYLPRKFHFFL